MPCQSGPSDSEVRAEQKSKHIMELEEMLCSSCRVLEEKDFDFDKNPQLSKWWAAHKAEDEAREKAALRNKMRRKMAMDLIKKPIGELTSEDKKLLRELGYL